jgi:predicted transcriptional regulator
MTGSAFPRPSPAERAWFCQQQAYADAIAYRRARLATPCPHCGPHRCDDHATDADLIISYQHAAAFARPRHVPGPSPDPSSRRWSHETARPPLLDGRALGLGRLETAIMTVAWRDDDWLTVGAIRDRLAYPREVAYTTVGTVAMILHHKSLLARRQGHARGAQYRAARPLDAHIGHLIAGLLACVPDPGQKTDH